MEIPTSATTQLDTLAINTLRVLAAEAIQKANSGHPGLPMGAAPMAYTLWTRHLRFNPANPAWPNRDRFVLSAGHGSMMLYGLLHLTGFDLSMQQIEEFRQWGSVTPGHPEFGMTPGVETTTGPLGQGFGNAVGMAMVEAHLAAQFNRDNREPVDHFTYAIVGDGDLMEGVQAEAASMAGHLGLGKLIVLYDDNRITIDGSTDLAFSEDVPARFEAYGWHTAEVADGTDIEAIDRAIEAAKAESARPSLIAISTRIGEGSPHKVDTASAHGEPLGEDELALTKRALGWPCERPFEVPASVLSLFRQALERGAQQESQWSQGLQTYAAQYPALAAELQRRLDGALPDDWRDGLPRFSAADGAIATRAASGKVLNALAARLPELIGGSADLAPSNKTLIDGSADFGRDAYAGRNLRFGVREHAMGAVLTGMALHGGVRPYGGTFLIFSDYMRPSLRLAAMMHLPVIYVYTHDSIAVGEDGPTHQPVEQLASLRAIPELTVIRPADGNETRQAWELAVQADGPVALALTRQKLPIVSGDEEGVARGGYVLRDAADGVEPKIILIASGSEVHLATEAYEALTASDIAARVVSLPSWEIFDRQDRAYRDSVLVPGVRCRLAIEAGVSMGWRRFVGEVGEVISIDRFGASAPGSVNMQKFGYTAANVEARARALLQAAAATGSVAARSHD